MPSLYILNKGLLFMKLYIRIHEYILVVCNYIFNLANVG